MAASCLHPPGDFLDRSHSWSPFPAMYGMGFISPPTKKHFVGLETTVIGSANAADEELSGEPGGAHWRCARQARREFGKGTQRLRKAIQIATDDSEKKSKEMEFSATILTTSSSTSMKPAPRASCPSRTRLLKHAAIVEIGDAPKRMNAESKVPAPTSPLEALASSESSIKLGSAFR